MKKKSKEPFIPPEKRKTVRKEIISLLQRKILSGKEISGYVLISEKEVYTHLDHIKKSIAKDKLKLIVDPAVCKKCGFAFKKRDRFKKPGKCPLCCSESIEGPFFSIR